MRLNLLHRSPPVLSVDNFFTDDECEEYIAKSSSRPANPGAEGYDEDAPVEVNSATFSSSSLSTRTSTTWFCRYSSVPTLLVKARRLLSALDVRKIEEPQLVRYRTGEQFSYHTDELPRGELLQNGGQRTATLLVYLRTIDEGRGGTTQFRDLKSREGEGCLAVRPERGSALLFFPSDKDGVPDDRTLHRGEVAVDEKVICQLWVHEGTYTPAVPKGNAHDEEMTRLMKEKREELGYSTTTTTA